MQDEKCITALFAIANHPDRFGYEHFGECSKRDNNRYIEANFCVATSSSEAIPMRTFLLRYSVAVQIAAGQVHETVHTLSIGKRQTKMTLAWQKRSP